MTPERAERIRGLLALTQAADERLGNSLASAVSADPALAPVINPRAQAVSAEVRQNRDAILRSLGEAAGSVPGATGIGASRSGALAELQSALAPALRA
jgi:hypothetical protein